MNKANLVQSLNKLLGNKNDAFRSVNRIFNDIKIALRNGDKVVISGFGSFKSRMMRARKFRNPKTKKETLLDPKQKVKFHQSNNFFK